LAEAEELLTTIGEWQERAVRLDRNQRQSRAKKRMLGRNAVRSGKNVQLRGGYRGRSYRGRGGQITWRAGVLHTGGNKRGENIFSRGENQMGPQRDPNAMDIDRERGEDRTYYHCGKFGHMARNCWERNRARVVEMLQELVKENVGQ